MGDFPAAVKDNIVLVQRGGCPFVEKVANAAPPEPRPSSS